MSHSFELPEVDFATVGTVGEPGQRTFYLQARQGGQLVTLKLEKQQVMAMAQFLGEILSDLPAPVEVPDDDALALAEPVLAEWAVGALQLAYDSTADRIVILAEEIGVSDADIGGEGVGGEDAVGIGQEPAPASAEPEDHAVGRLGLSRSQAAGIVRRGWELVSAGRPTCGLCGHPIDPEGHSCPRTNGHRRRAP
ncbi:MAG: DUF3090 family protein [Acidimicrobiales bacterium]